MATSETYMTDIDLESGRVHVELSDDEMVAWISEHVHGELVAKLLCLMEEYGGQQVVIATGVASCVDLWRRKYPERWAARLAPDAGDGGE
jgi:hypothetical protein